MTAAQAMEALTHDALNTWRHYHAAAQGGQVVGVPKFTLAAAGQILWYSREVGLVHAPGDCPNAAAAASMSDGALTCGRCWS